MTSPDELTERIREALYRNRPLPMTVDALDEAAATFYADTVLAEVTPELERREAEIDRLARELHAWRIGARRRTWPTVEAAPDGITYAAHLARAQGTEGGDEHDRLLRESSQRMKSLHDAASTLLQERDVLAWLHAEAVWQRNENAKLWASAQLEVEARGEVIAGWIRYRDRTNAAKREWRQRVTEAKAEQDALRAQLAAVAEPSDAMLDKAAVWLLRAKISRLAQDEPERTAWTWQQVLDKGDRDGWRKYARLMLVDLGLAAAVSESVPATPDPVERAREIGQRLAKEEPTAGAGRVTSRYLHALVEAGLIASSSGVDLPEVEAAPQSRLLADAIAQLGKARDKWQAMADEHRGMGWPEKANGVLLPSQFSDELSAAVMMLMRLRPGAVSPCSCSPAVVAVHQPAGDCWDAQYGSIHELLEAALDKAHQSGVEELAYGSAQSAGDLTLEILDVLRGQVAGPSRDSATGEASQVQANSKLEQNLDVGFASTPPAAGEADTTPPDLRSTWHCSGCKRFYFALHHVVCPGCERWGYWSGSHSGNGAPDGRPIGVEVIEIPLVEVLPNTEQEAEK